MSTDLKNLEDLLTTGHHTAQFILRAFQSVHFQYIVDSSVDHVTHLMVESKCNSQAREFYLRRSFFEGTFKVRGRDPVEGPDLALDHQVLLFVWSCVGAEQGLVAAYHYVPSECAV